MMANPYMQPNYQSGYFQPNYFQPQMPIGQPQMPAQPQQPPLDDRIWVASGICGGGVYRHGKRICAALGQQ